MSLLQEKKSKECLPTASSNLYFEGLLFKNFSIIMHLSFESIYFPFLNKIADIKCFINN